MENKYKVIIQYGLTGNYYAKCDSKEPLIEICNKIGKSTSSIVYKTDAGIYLIRVKNKKHKQKLKELNQTKNK